MEVILSVIAIVLSVISGGFALYTFYWTARRDRRQATLEAYNKLQRQALDHLNYYRTEQIYEITNDPRSEEYKKISTYIARIEHFCVGVNQKIYDPETVYALSEGYLDGTIKKRIEPMIQCKNSYGNRDYYENIHAVFDWMAKRREKYAGKQTKRN